MMYILEYDFPVDPAGRPRSLKVYDGGNSESTYPALKRAMDALELLDIPFRITAMTQHMFRESVKKED